MSAEIEKNGYDKNNEKVRANGGWITKEFLQDLISKHEKNDEIRVVDSDVSAAVGVGDNYLSILYRTKVDFVRKEGGPVEKLQLMIKGSPTSKFLKEMIQEMGIFRKELAMYNECLPAMKQILNEFAPEETNFLAAESYECDMPDTIVMEDLQVSGYKMANRRKQLDYDHCAVTLKSLARLHALSLKVDERNPELLDKVSYDFYQEENREKMEPYLENSFPVWTGVLETSPGCERFVPFLKKIVKYSFDKMLEIVKPTPGSISVLNHGDCWINNCLYKYDESGKVVHAKLVDYQLSRRASPATDLLYFLFTSPQPDVLSERFFDLIKLYYDAFVSDAKKLKVDQEKFTLDQLHEELKERSFFAFVVLATITPIIVAKPADAVDLENFDPDNKTEVPTLLNNYKDEYYLEIVYKYFRLLENLGYFKEAEERWRRLEELVEAKKAREAESHQNDSDLKYPSQPAEILANSA